MDMILNWVDKVKEFFKVATETDFEYGFVTGVLFSLGIVIFFLIIKLIFRIIFRVRKTKNILINPKDKDGKIIIQRSAVEAAIREDISKIHSISLNKVKIYRNNSAYFLWLNCSYDGKDGNLMAVREVLKNRLTVLFKEFFGVTNLKKIDIAFSKVAYFGNETAAVSDNSATGETEVAADDNVNSLTDTTGDSVADEQ